MLQCSCTFTGHQTLFRLMGLFLNYICIGEKSLLVRQLDSGQTLPSIPFPCFQTSFVHQLVLRCTCLVFFWK